MGSPPSWVPALAALGQDDDHLVWAKNQPGAVRNDRRGNFIVLGLFSRQRDQLLRLLDVAFFHAGFREDPHRRHHEYGGDDNEYRELRPDRRTAPERQYRGHNQRDGGDSSFDVSRHGNRHLPSVSADWNRHRRVGTAR